MLNNIIADHRVLRGLHIAAFACLSCAMLACGSKKTTGGGPGTPSFSNVVFIGDSLTAGFQNGSLIDTHQPSGYPSLIAAQAKFQITLPLIAPPGIPAVLQLVSVGPPPVIQATSGTTTGRDNPTVQPTNIAVPGHKLNDLINAAPTALPTTGEDIITNLVLGFPTGNTHTQLGEAVVLKPSTLFVWIGSDDALQADESGMPSSITPLAQFTTQYTQMITMLHTQLPNTTLVVANIPDVTAVPYLTPAAAVLAQASAQSGLSQAQLAAVLGIQPKSATYAGDLVNAQGLKKVQSILQSLAQGKQAGPIDDAGFLSAAEVTNVQQQVTQLNQVIAAQTQTAGGILIDINALFAKLQAGITINNYNATPGFLGGLFSLDGIHPTNTAYALIANQFIDGINAATKTTVPDVDVAAAAKTDPLFGPNIKAGASNVHITQRAADRVDWILTAHTRPAGNKSAAH